MKIIHTADWHLGQSFYEYDRKAEHFRFLSWLKEITGANDIDVLLIAGDIFDSPNPSAESQKMYYSFLRDITHANPHLQIIITAGNHDSAARLEAPNPLLEGMSVTVRGIVRRTADGAIDYENLIIPLNKGGYCLAVPYLRQGDYPDAENYSTSVKAMYDNLYAIADAKRRGDSHVSDNQRQPTSDCESNHAQDNQPQAASARESSHAPSAKPHFAPIIAIGHLQATGSEISENDRSERTIIGGLECVSPNAFADGIVYTALGHLHRGQRVSGRENVRYSGTPIPMSFAEKNNRQGVVFIEIGDTLSNRANHTTFAHNEEHVTDEFPMNEKGAYPIHIERIEYEDAVRLLSIPQEPRPLEEALLEIQSLPDGAITDTSPFLEIKVLISEPEPTMRHRIEEALIGKAVRLARISAVAQGTMQANKRTATLEELQEASPLDIAEKIFEHQYGDKMPETMRNLLLEVIREAEA